MYVNVLYENDLINYGITVSYNDMQPVENIMKRIYQLVKEVLFLIFIYIYKCEYKKTTKDEMLLALLMR